MSIDKHKSRLKALSIIGYLSLLLWLPVAVMSPMMFDSPESEKSVVLNTVLVTYLSLPIWIILGPFLAKRLLRAGHVVSAYCLVGLPVGLATLPLPASIVWVMGSLIF